VIDPNSVSLLSVFGAITPGTGGPSASTVFHGVPITGGTGSGRIADITVSGGGVTALKVINPGVGYGVGNVLSAAPGNIGGCTGFSVLAASTLNMIIAPPWVDTFIGSGAGSYIANTDLQAELRAATTIYMAAVQFTFQSQVAAHGVFLENANTSTCLFSGQGFGPSIFTSGYEDADPSMGWALPFFPGNTFLLAHYYAQKTIPYIIMQSDVILDSWNWLTVADTLVVYCPGGTYSLIHRNSSIQSTSDRPPPFVFWYSTTNNGGPFYAFTSYAMGGLERSYRGIGVSAYALPTWNSPSGGGGINAYAWATQGGKTDSSGIRPAFWTVPVLHKNDLVTIANSQNLPAITSPSSGNAYCQYPLVYGGIVYKTDFLSQSMLVGGGQKPGNILFESSHDFYSYHQSLTATANSFGSSITGLSWSARGQSWCVFMDSNSLGCMFIGLVIGLTTAADANYATALNYYVVTGVYPGLGFITVWNLATGGRFPEASYITGSKSTVYTGTAILAQPYRIRCISAPPYYASANYTAIVGQEILADTSGGAWTLTLPATTVNGGTALQQGDEIIVQDISGHFDANNLTVSPNGGRINSSTSFFVLGRANEIAKFNWVNTTIGWRCNESYLFVPPLIGSAFSPADATSNGYTLSNSNHTALFSSSTGVWWAQRGTSSQSAGKLYVEFRCTTGPTGTPVNVMVGFANAAFTIASGGYLGSAGQSTGFHLGGGVNYVSGSFVSPMGGFTPFTPVLKDVCALAIDFAAGKVWFAVNNVWLASGNPATGANPATTFAVATTGALLPGICIYDNGSGSWTMLTDASNQVYPPPSAFTAWG
jgi:hypothetical protein